MDKERMMSYFNEKKAPAGARWTRVLVALLVAGTALLTSCEQPGSEEISPPAYTAPPEKPVDPDPNDPADPAGQEEEPDPSLTTLDDVEAALAADEPVKLVIGAEHTFTWEQLLDAIKDACEDIGKNVALDLSRTQLAIKWKEDGTTVFDPRKPGGEPYNTGEPYITTLTLPNRPNLPNKTLEIAGGNAGDRGIFAGFTGLEEVYADEVATINKYAFLNTNTLQKAYFRAVENIGMQAFQNCPALADLYLPKDPPVLPTEGGTTTSSLFQINSGGASGTLTIHVPAGADYSEWENEGVYGYGGRHKPVLFVKN
jgi:hypothetical protein